MWIFITFSVYSCFLISFLASLKPISPYKTLQDFQKIGPNTLLMPRGSKLEFMIVSTFLFNIFKIISFLFFNLQAKRY